MYQSRFHKRFHYPIYSIYGFVRLADEIVDTFHDYNKKELLDRFKECRKETPGQGGEFSVVRWTAPSAGNVVVSADFRAVDNSGTTVAVVQGGVLLFSGSMNGQVGNTQSYALTTPRSVQAGDTLDFAVGGQWVDGSTASSARVTLTPVPGPGALVTALVGAVPGVFALLRRRNQKA
jgi:hypothetical protein